MAKIKRFKSIPEDVKQPIEVVIGSEAACCATMSLAALMYLDTAVSGFVCGLAFSASTLLSYITLRSACKSVKKTLTEQKIEKAKAQKAKLQKAKAQKAKVNKEVQK